MSFRFGRAIRAGIVLLFGLLIAYAPACGHDHGATGPTDAIYLGTATDEGLTNLEGLPTQTDVARAPLITSPAKDARLPSASPPTFSWKASPTALLRQSPARGYAAPLPFGPMRAAHAHGTPMSGRAYLVVFKGADGATVVRVFTTNTTYVPDADAFTKMKGAKTLTMTVATASFDNNNVVQGSGPFVGDAVTFSFDP